MTSSPTEVSSPGSDVAVISMACRFPGANTPDEFWNNLRSGRESITFFSDDQLEAAGVDPRLINHPDYVKARGVIPEIELFDAAFFGYSPRDAVVMDPQQRLFLQCSWEALETAGYDPKGYRGLIGVYAGATLSSYQSYLYAHPDTLDGADGMSIAIGNDLTFLTTRVSYKLNLRGPSCPVQTACSTSLVAVHLACQGLLNAECDMALAGGVSIRVPQETGYVYQEGGILSPDGHCRSFSAAAQGTIFSHGIGLVVLKRLEDALADGDCIHAVIKGSAINNDGSHKASFTAPGVGGQTEVVVDALASAEVDPHTISYIEAHGSGTSLGDSIEIQALTKAFANTSSRSFSCPIGSVKANIGHLDAAAGIAGFIKTILALKHKQIPPSPCFEKPNPDIRFHETPFYVNKSLSEWKQPEGIPRRAGVSSFGFGGTNAHVIVEEAPDVKPSGSARPWQILVLSAESEEALKTATSNLVEHFRSHPQLNLPDAAYTLGVGRRTFRHRLVTVCRNVDNSVASSTAVTALDTRDPQSVFTGFHDTQDRSVVFMFSGQGAQYVNMGLELYQDEPVFRDVVVESCEYLEEHLGFDLRDVLYPAEGVTDEASSRLTRTGVAQAALFVIEYGLARLWMDWGIKPTACIGHSIGEYVAACVSGVLNLKDALKLVALRGRLMEQMPEGVMVAVPLPEAQVRELLAAVRNTAVRSTAVGSTGDGLWLSVINGPSMCVVSGEQACVESFEARLHDRDIQCHRLHTSHAFHSGLMEGVVEPFVKAVSGVTRRSPQIPYISNLTGGWITESQVKDPAYWGRQIRETVRFADGITELQKQGPCAFLELGPGYALSALVRQQLRGDQTHVVMPVMRHAQEQKSDWVALLGALGRLWLSGVRVDWSRYYCGQGQPTSGSPEQSSGGPPCRRRIPLPTYPFQRQRYWVKQSSAGSTPARTSASSTAIRNTAVRSTAVGSSARQDGRTPNVADWLYTPAWTRSTLPIQLAQLGTDRHPHDPSRSGPAGRHLQNWLLFKDDCGLADRVIERLEALGHSVVAVVAGDGFRRLEDGSYTIDRSRRGDYDELIKAVYATAQAPDVVMHLWGVGPADKDANPGGLSRALLERGFGSMLYLAQALGGNNVTKSVRIAVVTNGVHEVTGVEGLHPEKATVVGLCRVIPQEYPHLSCRSFDLAGTNSDDCTDATLDALLNDVVSQASDSVVAYRGGHRWVEAYQPLCISETTGTPLASTRADSDIPAQHDGPPPRLRQKGVYLITGGLGEIGLELSEYLAQAVQARLVLTGRSGLPPRDQWDECLAAGGNHTDRSTVPPSAVPPDAGPPSAGLQIERRIRRIRKLEELGAEVLVIQADAGDLGQMRAAFVQAEKRFGTIHGVIHAAGLISGDAFRPISETDDDVCRRQFHPKVGGVCVLGELLHGRNLDFCMLVSSLSAVLGGIRYAAYASANAFLDAFACRANRNSTFPWLTVNWDSWLRAEDAARIKEAGKTPTGFVMTPAEGVSVFRRILSVEAGTQIVVSTGDLQARIDQWVRMAPAQDGADAREPDATTRHPRPDLQTEYAAPGNDLEQSVADIWQKLLGVDRVGVNDNFFELGGDSFLGIQVIARLKKELAEACGPMSALSAASLYEGPTVASLAIIIGTSKDEPPQAFDHSRSRGEKRRQRTLRRQAPTE